MVCARYVRQPPTCGDEHGTAGIGGDEIADLRAVERVVQHDEYATVGHQRPVQRQSFGPGLRDDRRTERPQELAEHLGHVHRVSGRGTQLHVELTVGIALGGQVRDPYGQRRLTDAARAGEDHHRHRSSRIAAEQPRRFRDEVFASHELGHIRWQLPRYLHPALRSAGHPTGNSRFGGRDDFLGTVGDRVVQRPQGLIGHLGPILRQDFGVPLVCVHRVGGVTTPVRDHQQLLQQPPVVRERRCHDEDVVQDRVVIAATDLQVEEADRGAFTSLNEVGDLAAERFAGHVRKRALAAPQIQRSAQPFDLIVEQALPSGLLGIAHQSTEHQHVEIFVGDADLVTDTGVGQQIVFAIDLAEQVT